MILYISRQMNNEYQFSFGAAPPGLASPESMTGDGGHEVPALIQGQQVRFRYNQR